MENASQSRPDLIFIHGLMGSGQGFKATWLRQRYPWMLAPDFEGDLPVRMQALDAVLIGAGPWTLIGSSFGGLMAALFAAQQPQRVRRLVLLAPALVWPDFAMSPPPPVHVPGAIYQGSLDELLPYETVRQLAAQVFPDLAFHLVEDDHSLHATVRALDWDDVLNLKT